MLIYILKSAACLAILLLFYKLFLEKENMHVFKRFYLLGSLLFALVVPAIVFTEYVEVAPVTSERVQEVVVTNLDPNIPPALESDVLDIAPLLWIVYFLGMLFFGIKFLKNLFQIFRRIRRNPKYKSSGFIQVLLQEKIPPHTFFKYIFLNKSKFESKEIPKEVLLHEETHARERHSLDVVFIELLQVIFWVNPLIHFFKKAIKLNHEFLADRAVLDKDIDPVTYQNTLLSFLSSESAKKYQPTLPNAINYSSIKKRFTVMKSKTSKKSIVLRSFLLLPLLAILLAGFTETKIVPREIPTSATIIEIEVNSNGKIWLEDVPVQLNRLSGKLLAFFPEDSSANVVSVEINSEEAINLNFINEISEEIQKAGITDIIVFVEEVIMPEEEYKDNIEITSETVILKTNKMTFVETSTQGGATKEQVAEYNALAKKYNSMLEGDRFTIRMTDVERIEHLHGLMTEEQRSNAEPFPDFPEPPPPPEAPEEIEEEMIEMEREMERQELIMKEREVEMKELEHAMEEKEIDMARQERRMEEQETEKQERALGKQEPQTDFPAPPNLAYRVDQKPLSNKLKRLLDKFAEKRELYRNAVKDYLNHGKGNEDKIQDIYRNLLEVYDEYKVMANDEGVFAQAVPVFAPKVKKGEPSDIPPPPTPTFVSVPVTPEEATDRLREDLKSKNSNGEITEVPESPKRLTGSPPPPPPTPKSPLDHAIEMAKQGATFYYKKKKITSDEAIAILKKNKDLSMDISKTNGEKPIVKIDTHF